MSININALESWSYNRQRFRDDSVEGILPSIQLYDQLSKTSMLMYIAVCQTILIIFLSGKHWAGAQFSGNTLTAYPWVPLLIPSLGNPSIHLPSHQQNTCRFSFTWSLLGLALHISMI